MVQTDSALSSNGLTGCSLLTTPPSRSSSSCASRTAQRSTWRNRHTSLVRKEPSDRTFGTRSWTTAASGNGSGIVHRVWLSPQTRRSTGMREIFFQRWTDLPSRLGEPDSSKSTRRDCKVKKHLSLKTGRVRASVLRRFRCASADSGTRECGNRFGSGYSSSSKHTNWNRRWMRSFQSGHENRPMSFGHSFCGALQ